MAYRPEASKPPGGAGHASVVAALTPPGIRILTASTARAVAFPNGTRIPALGQGTLDLEMIEDRPDLDVPVAPIGGGGPIAGIGVIAKSMRPDIGIVGVEATGWSAMRERLAGEPVNVGGDTVAEGAGAAALAALIRHRDRFAGRAVGVPITGGNIDLRVLADAPLRGLARDGRLSRIAVSVADVAGSLAAPPGAGVRGAGGRRVDPRSRPRAPPCASCAGHIGLAN